MIVFDDNTIAQVIDKFTEIINRLQSEGKIPKNPNHPCKAIGWTVEHEEEKNLGIKDYNINFRREVNLPKIEYPNLKSYIIFCKKNTKELRSIRDNILNAILRILVIEKIKSARGSKFNSSTFSRFLSEEHNSAFDELKMNLYKWSSNIYRGRVDEVYAELKEYIPKLLQEVFNVSNINEETKEFIDTETDIHLDESGQMSQEKQNIENIYESNGVKIEIGTVHSVKGETHCATLYLETFYEGNQAYESRRLEEQFKQVEFNDARKYHEQSVKMAYVGFSRATHLLCFAVHRDRVPDVENSASWEKVEIF
ncbi:MAG: hypothetical protein ACYCXU_02895 [Thermoleophilia bacterium]